MNIHMNIQVGTIPRCAAFRRRVGRRKGGQREDEEVSKKSRWDVMSCGDLDESDGSDFEKYVQERDTSVTASEGAKGEDATRSLLIPTPGWRNVTEGDSDKSGDSTFSGDGIWVDREICEEDFYRGEFMRWELVVQI